MKILDMIYALELDKNDNLPIIPLRPGQHPKDKLSIFSTSKGISFYEGESIWSLSIYGECKNEVYKLQSFIKKQFAEVYDNERELNKYLAVVELLLAVDEYQGGEGNINIDKAKKYVGIINSKIYSSLDFCDIQEMKDLIDIIKRDKLYKELCFNVNEVCSNKSERYRGVKKQENSYRFGNVQYHEELDVVCITVYNDYVELTHRGEGKSYERELNSRKEYTLEQKIISALDCWKCAYWN